MGTRTKTTGSLRGPAGNIRNFGAMNPSKIVLTWKASQGQPEDIDGRVELIDELIRRRLYTKGMARCDLETLAGIRTRGVTIPQSVLPR